jgi:hypothetical protein
MLDSMPMSEKYALLIQSYAGKVLEGQQRDGAALTTIESLYVEMLAGGNRPTEKTSQLYLDAASAFCSSATLGRALQLGKASGSVKAFGSSIGQLTTPITNAAVAATLFATSSKMTSDDRESEILYATLAALSVFVFAALQVVGWVDKDVHPYATLWGCAISLAAGADVALTQGSRLKVAAAGFERLSLRDPQRDAYTEASAFLVGYLLGLPCFCFKPDAAEALKLLRVSPGSLDVYKQPVALLGAGKGKGPSSSSSSFSLAFNLKMAPSSSSAASAAAAAAGESKEEANSRLLKALLDVDGSSKADLAGLSRLLVWLVAPVAAETIKYGSTVSSDPRRGRRMLSALESLQVAIRKQAAQGVKGAQGGAAAEYEGEKDEAGADLDGIAVPASKEDKEALVQWAYSEALGIIRRYGDLLEQVCDYIQSGTASVGECALLIERELR